MNAKETLFDRSLIFVFSYMSKCMNDLAFLWDMRFSGTCGTETPQPIDMKFRVLDYGGRDHKTCKNWLESVA